VQFAVGVPNVREYGDPCVLLDLGRRAERANWDAFFVWDHLVYRQRGDPVCDPWIALTAVAAATTRVRLGVMVCALARRRPWKVARETAALDILSDGRLVFGAGLGSLPTEEFAAFGENPDDRARADRLDEALSVLTGLWTGEPFSFHGRYHTVEETIFRPPPVQQPVPVWIAGRWPNCRPFGRAARWQGVFATHDDVGQAQTMTPDQLAEIVRYTIAQRPDDGPFEVVIEGASKGSRSQDAARVAAYEAVGLTWWVEKLGFFRGTLDEMRGRIEQGPPR
jgi:alkanesulfonate monooxygenase SsuD/methylene tetrahydromethanopterin reductase-like flavin-dependent oxidoreductase (luciferase family)